MLRFATLALPMLLASCATPVTNSTQSDLISSQRQLVAMRLVVANAKALSLQGDLLKGGIVLGSSAVLHHGIEKKNPLIIGAAVLGGVSGYLGVRIRTNGRIDKSLDESFPELSEAQHIVLKQLVFNILRNRNSVPILSEEQSSRRYSAILNRHGGQLVKDERYARYLAIVETYGPNAQRLNDGDSPGGRKERTGDGDSPGGRKERARAI